ncbi:MAG: YraN family protein [Phascolarctobacterium sp.]|nr:YraN family protein [Phascolarctobacterium sp.]MBQ7759692.1 YraN family protein [Acidaminococcaceae bacterium]MBQ7884200.1 YraN family protein [Phascolarctobacterium sp.]
MNHRIELGKFGEDFACSYLQKQGYKILYRNFRCRLGEIDIIAVKNDVLSFIEVKTRRQSNSTYGMPREAVNQAKQKKIYRCAELYMQSKGIILTMPVLSFDVIEIITEGTAVKDMHHYPHCF